MKKLNASRFVEIYESIVVIYYRRRIEKITYEFVFQFFLNRKRKRNII